MDSRVVVDKTKNYNYKVKTVCHRLIGFSPVSHGVIFLFPTKTYDWRVLTIAPIRDLSFINQKMHGKSIASGYKRLTDLPMDVVTSR